MIFSDQYGREEHRDWIREKTVIVYIVLPFRYKQLCIMDNIIIIYNVDSFN